MLWAWLIDSWTMEDAVQRCVSLQLEGQEIVEDKESALFRCRIASPAATVSTAAATISPPPPPHPAAAAIEWSQEEHRALIEFLLLNGKWLI